LQKCQRFSISAENMTLTIARIAKYNTYVKDTFGCGALKEEVLELFSRYLVT
jgi:hypothetical protein